MILANALACPECRGERYVPAYRSNWGNLCATEEWSGGDPAPCETCGPLYAPTGLVDAEITSEGAWFEGDGPYAFYDLEHKLSTLLLDDGLIEWPSVVRILQLARSMGSWESHFTPNRQEKEN